MRDDSRPQIASGCEKDHSQQRTINHVLHLAGNALLIDPGNQTRTMSTVAIVLSTEVLAQEPLLGMDAGDENGNYE
jgi:hypothetical protein